MAVTYQWRRHLPRSKQIRLARSFDGGKTWLQSDTSVDTAGTAFAPKAAWGKGRNLVLVWADERRQERVWDIYARRSTDGGATWGPEQVLSRFPEQLGSDIYFRPEVVADGQNTFWAVWVGLRSGRSKLYLSRSTDGGQTWADPKELSGASQSVFGHRVVRAGERLLVVWQDTIIGGQDRLYSTSSSDSGATWTAPTRVDHLPTDMATGAVGPSMVMNEAGEALVAWHDGRNGRDDIFVGRSADGGRTWQAETRLDTDEPGTAFSRFTAMAAAGDGRIAVAWGDDRDGFEGVYLRIRSAGANPTWGPEVVVAGPSGKKGARTPGLLWAKDGSLFVTWEVWDYTFGPQAVTKRVDGRQIAPDKK
jgi:hypothetical protein